MFDFFDAWGRWFRLLTSVLSSQLLHFSMKLLEGLRVLRANEGDVPLQLRH